MSMQSQKDDLVDKKFSIGKNQLKIVAMLYSTCNNNCDFCFQKGFRDKLPTAQQFKECYLDYKQQLVSQVEENYSKFDEISISFMGGELFIDDSQIVEKLKDIILALKKYDKVDIRVASNLLSNNANMQINMIDFMERNCIKYTMYTSYDFGSLRYEDADVEERYVQNLKKVVNKLDQYGKKITVEVIRTKHMLKSLSSADHQSKNFRYITDNCRVTLNEINGNFPYMLNATESVQLWKITILNYPKVSDLYSHFNNVGRNCLNTRRMVVTDKNVYTNCYSYKFVLLDTQYEEKKTLSYKMLEQYNCIMCKYFNKCSLKCPLEYKYEYCDIKQVKDWMEENNIKV